MLATLVFLVVVLEAKEFPTFSIVEEITQTTELTPMQNCKAVAKQVTDDAKQYATLMCIEVVQHDKNGNSYNKSTPPDNERKIGHST